MCISSQIMDMNFSVAMTTGETDWLIVSTSPGFLHRPHDPPLSSCCALSWCLNRFLQIYSIWIYTVTHSISQTVAYTCPSCFLRLGIQENHFS